METECLCPRVDTIFFALVGDTYLNMVTNTSVKYASVLSMGAMIKETAASLSKCIEDTNAERNR